MSLAVSDQRQTKSDIPSMEQQTGCPTYGDLTRSGHTPSTESDDLPLMADLSSPSVDYTSPEKTGVIRTS